METLPCNNYNAHASYHLHYLFTGLTFLEHFKHFGTYIDTG